MKTAISIPDPIARSAERLAKDLEKPLDRLYSDAVAEYVARHDPTLLTERINEVCCEVDTRPDAFLTEAARQGLKRNDW
jgi:hypothetical protein